MDRLPVFQSQETDASAMMSHDAFLLFAGFSCHKGRLTDAKLLFDVMKTLPTLIHMRAIGQPTVTEATENPGLEGYVPIDLSNITLSTYVDDLKIVGCVHSCKQFDFSLLLKYIQRKYGCAKLGFKCVGEQDMTNVVDHG